MIIDNMIGELVLFMYLCKITLVSVYILLILILYEGVSINKCKTTVKI